MHNRISLLLVTWILPCLLYSQRTFEEQPGKPLDTSLVTGALIDEAAVQQTIYVNTQNPAATDGNSGLSAAAPKRSLLSALTAALDLLTSSGEGVRIYLSNGTYASPSLTAAIRNLTANQKALPLIIEGESRGGVIIDCTEAIDSAAIMDLGDGLYGFVWEENRGLTTRAWKNGPNSAGSAIGHRSENLFIDGQRLEPVLIEPYSSEMVSSSEVSWTYQPDLYVGRALVDRAGTFGVSEIEEDMIFFRPPEGVDMQAAAVRYGVNGAVLDFREKSNLVVRNLVISGTGAFHHFDIVRIWGASGENRIGNILIEDVEFHSLVGGPAIGVSNAENVTFRRIIARDCGGNGYAGTRVRNFLIEDIDMSQNNWLTLMAGIERWVAAGWKLLESEDILVQRYVGSENGASGFWFDTEIWNASVNRMYLADNYVFGFYNEKNFGEILVEDSVFVNNRRYGFYFAESSNTTVRNSVVMGNGESAFAIRIYNPPRTQNDRLLVPQDNRVEGCLASGSFPDAASLYTYDGGGTGSDYRNSFVATFTGDNNRYWMPFFTKVFNIGGGADLDGWRAAIAPGQEMNSVFEDPRIDMSGDGLVDFYLYENVDTQDIVGLKEESRFNQFAWDGSNRRPVVEMPYNWRQGAAIEASFLLKVPESGNYSLVLNSNCSSALHMGEGDSLNSVSSEPLIDSGSSVNYHDWDDSGNGQVELFLEADTPYAFVLRAVTPHSVDLPFLVLGWNTPWMEVDAIKPIAAPYIRSSEEVPVVLTGFLSAAERKVNNSFALEGFGAFWEVGQDYIYHAVHKVLYIPDGQSLSGFWGYFGSFGWTYFNPSFGESWIYSWDLNSWIYAYGSFDGNSWYYVFSGPSTGYVMNP